ncbi:MAG: TRAP transporter TatT component family protein, partial [Candidatus Latescibacterota bacterium]
VWTAANWSQFISLHLDSTDVLVDIPRVMALLERAGELDGSYYEGLPHIILGSLHAFRPPLMGGSPDKSRENFERANQISQGKFLLSHVFYAKFYCYRVQDSDEFDRALNGILAEPLSILPRYRLLNEIAKQKAERLLGEKDELF